MRTTEKFNFGDYKQTIVLEVKKIVDVTCMCIYGLTNKDMWKNPNKKPCEHATSALLHWQLKTKNGVKEKKKMLGPTKLPSWLRLAYFKAVDFTCEDDHKVFTESELEVHRIIPGYKGGTYRPGNVKILCKEDHKKYAEEW